MTLRMPSQELDYNYYQESLYSCLSRESTHVFIDTSVLLWLYSVGSTVRNAFINWAKPLSDEGRLHVPGWVVHEFSQKVSADDVKAVVSYVGGIRSAVKTHAYIRENARLVIDERLSSRFNSTPKDLVANIESALDTLEKLSALLQGVNQNLKAKIDNEIFPLVDSCAIDSDVFSRISALKSEYESRVSARMGPGYLDSSKVDNALGDYIIWQEILDYCRLHNVSSCVLLTQESKQDWIHTPKRVTAGGHSMENGRDRLPRISLMSPVLDHEIRINTRVRETYVSDVRALFHALFCFESNFSDEAAWAMRLPSAYESVDHNEEVALSIQDNILDVFSDFPNWCFVDSDYNTGSKLHSLSTRMRSKQWSDQNPAIDEFMSISSDSTLMLEELFVVGRSIYHAAVSSSHSATRFIDKLDSSVFMLSVICRQALVAGMLYEVYFSSDGKLRPKPKWGYADKLLDNVMEGRYGSAVSFINHKLSGHTDKLLWVPSAESPYFDVDIVFCETMTGPGLRHLSHDGLVLISSGAHGESYAMYDDMYFGAGSGNLQVSDAIALVAEHYCIHSSIIRSPMAPSHPISIYTPFLAKWSTSLPIKTSFSSVSDISAADED